jgi:hypothetical protein
MTEPASRGRVATETFQGAARPGGELSWGGAPLESAGARPSDQGDITALCLRDVRGDACGDPCQVSPPEFLTHIHPLGQALSLANGNLAQVWGGVAPRGLSFLALPFQF